tara:strand:- start:82 stop:489 length:408 start_codon:yes stop_codon:yes gene_type:complete
MSINEFDFDNFDFNDFDFGIKSVSSDQVDQSKQQTEKLDKVSANSENVSKKLNDIEVKLDELMVATNQNISSRVEERKMQLDVSNKEKFGALEKLIIPLLMNLAKDSDSNPYIHWPNRKEVVQDQIKRILTITRE